MVYPIMMPNARQTIGSRSGIFWIIRVQSRIAQQSGDFVKGWIVKEKSTSSGMNFRDNSMKKDTKLNEVLFRMLRLSRLIPVMRQRINQDAIKRRPDAAGMEVGLKGALNLNLDLSCTR